MLDLYIEHLRLNLEGEAGQEHRVRPIAERAIALLADRLDEYEVAPRTRDRQMLDQLPVPPVSLHLNGLSNQQAADQLARALLEALALKLGV